MCTIRYTIWLDSSCHTRFHRLWCKNRTYNVKRDLTLTSTQCQSVEWVNTA